MPCFRCSKCGCVENTACTDFWWRTKEENLPPLCSECLEGKWHGRFEKRSASGWYYDKDGFIYSPAEVDAENMEWTYNRNFKMVGRYTKEGECSS